MFVWALAAVLVLGVSGGCSSAESRSPAPLASSRPAGAVAVASAVQGGVIDHVLPRPDSVGEAPSRFEWTKAAGADFYVISVWNEVDTLIWRQGNLRTTEIGAPEDLALEPGTYFWAVVGFRDDGRPVAESGLAAFVVRDRDSPL